MKKESYIEKKCCDIAKNKGYNVRKLSYIQRNGAPDRMFFKKGHLFFVEFKKEDGIMSSIQEIEFNLLKDATEIYTINNIEEFERILK